MRLLFGVAILSIVSVVSADYSKAESQRSWLEAKLHTKIFPHGCVAHLAKQNSQKQNFFDLISNIHISTSEKLIKYISEEPDKVMNKFNNLYLLFEQPQYVSLDFFKRAPPVNDPTDQRTLSFEQDATKSGFYKKLSASPVTAQYIVGLYLLGNYGIPLNVPETAKKIESIIEGFWICKGKKQMPISLPLLLHTIGKVILNTLNSMQKSQVSRDFKLASSAATLIPKDHFEMIKAVHTYLAQGKEFTRITADIIELMRREAESFSFLAMVQMTQAYCGTDRFSFKALFSWKLVKKCKATDFENSDVWANLAFFGKKFMELGKKFSEQDESSQKFYKKSVNLAEIVTVNVPRIPFY